MTPRWVRQRLHVIAAVLLTLQYGTAYAALAEVWPDVAGLPWAQIAVGCGVSVFGGTTNLLLRYLDAKYNDAEFPLGHELLAMVFVSACTAFLTYMIGAWASWGPALTGAILLAGGFVGSRYLRMITDKAVAFAVDTLRRKEP
jgi:hypothetical protein